MKDMLKECGASFEEFREAALAEYRIQGDIFARMHKVGAPRMSVLVRGGAMRPIRNIVLPVGSLCWSFGGYGNEDREWVVAGKPDGSGCQPLLALDGSARRSWVVGEDDAAVSEKFGVGLYWDDRPEAIGVRLDDGEIAALAGKVLEAERKAADARAAAAVAWAAETERLRAEFAGILVETPQGPEAWKGARARMKKNVVALLRIKFPGVKFRVRMEYDCGTACRVEWTGGPDVEAVQGILAWFTDSRFDGMIDAWESCKSPFSTLYGGCNGHWCYRTGADGRVEQRIA